MTWQELDERAQRIGRLLKERVITEPEARKLRNELRGEFGLGPLPDYGSPMDPEDAVNLLAHR